MSDLPQAIKTESIPVGDLTLRAYLLENGRWVIDKDDADQIMRHAVAGDLSVNAVKRAKAWAKALESKSRDQREQNSD